MMNFKTGLLSLLVFCGACSQVSQKEDIVKDSFDFAGQQLKFAFTTIDSVRVKQIEAGSKKKLVSPRTIDDDGSFKMVASKDWTSGFFPGELWYMYEYTKDDYWKSKAQEFTANIEDQKTNGGTHDMGFKMYCSFGNGYRLTQNTAYKNILLESATTLITRYKPTIGCIRSWDHSRDKWQCPVIIDNMMNLEILFEATSLSGDSTFYNMAVSHADMTLKNHFRMDGSSYHVVDYDMRTGKVRSRCTAQGYSDESAWARGQAWGIYGYTMCYRYTRQLKYLEQAEAAYEFVCTHPNLPEDLIPYWDFDAVNIPHELRDASAAAIMAAALYELSMYSNKAKYKETADKVMHSLSSSDYRSKIGENHNFLLMHSVGSYPHGNEIDVPLIYADYYFLEALKRKRDCDIEAKSKSVQK